MEARKLDVSFCNGGLGAFGEVDRRIEINITISVCIFVDTVQDEQETSFLEWLRHTMDR
jgi:hypothetical protein